MMSGVRFLTIADKKRQPTTKLRRVRSTNDEANVARKLR